MTSFRAGVVEDEDVARYQAENPGPARLQHARDSLDPVALARIHPGWFAVLTSGGRYTPARHLQLLHQKLVLVAAGKLRRLLVLMPPRHGKSETISRYFPAWYLGAFPRRKLILTSYGHSLAVEHCRFARDLFAEWGPRIFGVRGKPDVWAADDWQTEHGGGMVAEGVNGTLTGRGAHVALIDDPVKGEEDAESQAARDKLENWYHKVLSTRLEPGGAIVCLMTPWHEDDLGQRLIKASEAGTGERWEVLRLPALAEENDPLGRAPGELLWPERWTEEDVRSWKKSPTTFHALYQCRPRPAGGNEWPDSAFAEDRWVNELPPNHLAKLRVIACDPSLGESEKSDYSAIVRVALVDGLYYVQADLARRPTGTLVSDLVDHAVDFRPHAVCLETNGFQELLRPMITGELERRALPPLPIYEIKNTAQKVIRIRRLEPAICHGRVRWVRTAGTRELVRQLQAFPKGDHDDGPDAMEMAQRVILELWGEAEAA